MPQVASSDVYVTLFDRIVGGELEAGARLKEIVLSKEFGISRTPVRDALRQLANDGPAEIVPAQGAYATCRAYGSISYQFVLASATAFRHGLPHGSAPSGRSQQAHARAARNVISCQSIGG